MKEKKTCRKIYSWSINASSKKKDTIKDEMVNDFDTVAIRIPDDEFVLKLLKEVGPMFVTSANISGKPTTNSHDEVLNQLNGKIDLIVEGKAKSGISSTIIDCTKEELIFIREGDITKKTLTTL